jgi:chemotaxis response regulator CheB
MIVRHPNEAVVCVILRMPSRILIADDSLVIRRALKSELLNAGFEVCGEAEDGRAAVEKALELKPDLVVIDLVMPRLNGLAASREISRGLPGVPIVMHSVHVLREHEEEAKKNGVSRVVPKSEFNTVSVIRELLGLKVNRNEEANPNPTGGHHGAGTGSRG